MGICITDKGLEGREALFVVTLCETTNNEGECQNPAKPDHKDMFLSLWMPPNYFLKLLHLIYGMGFRY